MIETLQGPEVVMRRIASAVRSVQLYAPTHPLVRRNIGALGEAVADVQATSAVVTIGFVGDTIVVADLPLVRQAASVTDLAARLRSRGIERIAIERGVTPDECARLVHYLAEAGSSSPDAHLARIDAPDFAHVRIGRIAIDREAQASVADMSTIRRLYSDAVSAAQTIWDGVQREARVDADTADGVVQGLAHAVVQNRTALLALTAVKNHDNYTFTHMVNVSVLTMAQARSVGVDGPLLREFGLAALLHDIGKVRTPLGILTKPERLTDEEFAIMRRHPVDGAEILRRTPDVPPLVPIVAFEHHLRRDGSGYPAGATRPVLNLATVLTGIADVFDAMRSQRVYQPVFASERVIAVLRRNDGREFDQHLVRRFVQLLGIYPVGTAVRLDTGHVGVVIRVNASDPHRPRVRVLIDPEGQRLPRPFDADVWANAPGSGKPSSVAGPVDAEAFGVDPLAHLDGDLAA